MSGTEDASPTEALPEIRCDFNARITRHGHMVLPASIEDLAKAGLTPATAVGQRLLFNGGADLDKNHQPADILCAGTVVHHPELGFLLETDVGGYFWRPYTTGA